MATNVTRGLDALVRGTVDRVSPLSRERFEAVYRSVRPVVVPGCAKDMPAFHRWSMDYLDASAGSAQVYVSDYRAESTDYDRVVHEPTTLRAFIRELGSDTGDRCIYLFNNASCVFARNERRQDLHTGWARLVNPGLAPLADDFVLPSFVRHEDYVLASLVVGSQRNGTDLHYDSGGEAKLLVQLRGVKRLLLLPPSAASLLGMRTPFKPAGEEGKRSNPSRVDATTETMTPLQIDAVKDAGLCAELHPGDVVYWPAFWFHEVTNAGSPNVAVGVFIDEVHLSPLLMRHLLLKTFRDFRALLQVHGEQAGADGLMLTNKGSAADLGVSLLDVFRLYEAFLLSPACSRLSNLWQWNAVTPKISSGGRARAQDAPHR